RRRPGHRRHPAPHGGRRRGGVARHPGSPDPGPGRGVKRPDDPDLARAVRAGRPRPRPFCTETGEAPPRRRIALPSRLTLRVVAALLLALALPGPAGADSVQGITDTTIKIGNMGPYTGDASSFSALNYGPLAYFRAVNAQGGVHGRKFELVSADDACKETTGI